jgi:hypothetical protein
MCNQAATAQSFRRQKAVAYLLVPVLKAKKKKHICKILYTGFGQAALQRQSWPLPSLLLFATFYAQHAYILLATKPLLLPPFAQHAYAHSGSTAKPLPAMHACWMQAGCLVVSTASPQSPRRQTNVPQWDLAMATNR